MVTATGIWGDGGVSTESISMAFQKFGFFVVVGLNGVLDDATKASVITIAFTFPTVDAGNWIPSSNYESAGLNPFFQVQLIDNGTNSIGTASLVNIDSINWNLVIQTASLGDFTGLSTVGQSGFQTFTMMWQTDN